MTQIAPVIPAKAGIQRRIARRLPRRFSGGRVDSAKCHIVAPMGMKEKKNDKTKPKVSAALYSVGP